MLKQYIDNLYNYGLFHNPSQVESYDVDHIPFLQDYDQRMYVFDSVREKIAKYGESDKLHKNQSNGFLFKESTIITDDNIDLCKQDVAEQMKNWAISNSIRYPYNKEHYMEKLNKKIDELDSFKANDLLSNEKNVEIKRRIIGSLTEKLIEKQSYNKNLKTNIPAYRDNKIVGNYDTLNNNGIYIDIKTKFNYYSYMDLDLKISGNYFNTLHLVNSFYNTIKTDNGIKIKYIGYINLIKELSNKKYKVKEKYFHNDYGYITSKYNCFEFAQHNLIKPNETDSKSKVFNLTLTDIFNQ